MEAFNSSTLSLDTQSEWSSALTSLCDHLHSESDFSSIYGEAATSQLCTTLARTLQQHVDRSTAYNQQTVLSVLRCIKTLMRERSSATAPLFTESAIRAYFDLLCNNDSDETVVDETLKCCNNCFFDNSAPQLIALDETDPASNIDAVLTANLTQFTTNQWAKLCQVLLLFFNDHANSVSNKLMDDDEKFIRAVIRELSVVFHTQFLAQLPDDELVVENTVTSEIPAPVVDFLVSGLKLVYAVMVSNPEGVFKMTQDDARKGNQGEPTNAAIVADEFSESDRLGIIVFLATMMRADGEAAAAQLTGIQDQAINILMNATKNTNYASFVAEKGMPQRMCALLEERVDSVIDAEGVITSNAFQRCGPLVIAINSLATAENNAKDSFKSAIFSKELDPMDVDGLSEDELKQAYEKRHVAGSVDPTCLGGKLARFLTDFDSNLKRVTGECLYNVCDEDSKEFIRLVGYGNGVHMMAIKAGMMGQVLQQQEQARAERERKARESGE